MKLRHTFSLAALLLMPLAVSLPAAAQTASSSAASAVDDMSEGEIRKVSKDTGKLTIKHGEIKNLDMPPMTMVFTAKEPALLDKVAVGDKVRFVVVEDGGKMVVTDIQVVK
jgi:Cu(I)/Ag(I) efflux system periplasmic protein CusF